MLVQLRQLRRIAPSGMAVLLGARALAAPLAGSCIAAGCNRPAHGQACSCGCAGWASKLLPHVLIVIRHAFVHKQCVLRHARAAGSNMLNAACGSSGLVQRVLAGDGARGQQNMKNINAAYHCPAACSHSLHCAPVSKSNHRAWLTA